MSRIATVTQSHTIGNVSGLLFSIEDKTGTHANDFRDQAVWYAWGMADSGAFGNALTLDDGYNFGIIVRDLVETYDRGLIFTHGSMMDMWADYCALVGARKLI